MAQIHPKQTLSSSRSSERERFTVWMKSLVLNGYGCTVYSSKGDVVFRVDNYQQRCSSKVLLMDSSGEVLFSIRKKKLRMLGCWEGYKWSDSEGKPWFQVRKERKIMSKNSCCQVSFGCDKNSKSYYKIVGLNGKSTLKIVDKSGQLLAEVIHKQSIEGVPFGDDVLQLIIVELKADRALIMALITVYGLINNIL